jgi:N-acetyl-alpha-D-muramate 1-phosphate uridylyltransferase
LKAMILAAGRGERMRPLTDVMPKALLPVGGKPLIVWHIEKLARAGFDEVIINHAHLGELIESTLGNGDDFDVTIYYSPERAALETAGGIANALPLLGEHAFPVINADVFCDYDFRDLHAETVMLQDEGRYDSHLILVDNPDHHRDGDFTLHGRVIVPRGTPRLTFSGIGVYRPTFFKDVARGQAMPLAPLLCAAIAAGRTSGEHYTGMWTDVGTPQRLAELNQTIQPKVIH